MLYEVDEVTVGQVVYLYPHTKTASRACHEQRRVTILHDPKKHWPHLVVEWQQDGEAHWELVHRDNIKKRPATAAASPTEKHQGDMAGGTQTETRWRRKNAIASPVVNIEGQEALF